MAADLFDNKRTRDGESPSNNRVRGKN